MSPQVRSHSSVNRSHSSSIRRAAQCCLGKYFLWQSWSVGCILFAACACLHKATKRGATTRTQGTLSRTHARTHSRTNPDAGLHPRMCIGWGTVSVHVSCANQRPQMVRVTSPRTVATRALVEWTFGLLAENFWSHISTKTKRQTTRVSNEEGQTAATSVTKMQLLNARVTVPPRVKK